jgi:Ca2+-binding RTX toxin-like protein
MATGSVSISDDVVVEGDAGETHAIFTLTRTGGDAAFDVAIETVNGTAVAGPDYSATAGTVQFALGENTRTITISVNGDTDIELNETFFVNLLIATNGATISDAQGQATIINDDANSAPIFVQLLNPVLSFTEQSQGFGLFKVADIAVTDDQNGSNILSLTGADAASFVIVGTELFLNVTNGLDFETKPFYQVAVQVDDPSAGTTPDVTSATFTLSISNVSPEIHFGTDGNDILIGGSDIDLFVGSLGKDTLTGRAGKDVFDFDAIQQIGKTKATRDVITDFKHGQDKIDLFDIDAIKGTAKNDKFKFIGSADFHHVKGELHFAKVDLAGKTKDYTLVSGDINGDGKADFQLELKGLISLTKGDFVL